MAWEPYRNKGQKTNRKYPFLLIFNFNFYLFNIYIYIYICFHQYCYAYVFPIVTWKLNLVDYWSVLTVVEDWPCYNTTCVPSFFKQHGLKHLFLFLDKIRFTSIFFTFATSSLDCNWTNIYYLEAAEHDSLIDNEIFDYMTDLLVWFLP